MLRALIVGLLLLFAAPGTTHAQSAGALVSAEPASDAPSGMRAWRIRYITSDGDGRPIAVTGIVVAPPGGGADRPVIAWTHGTWGVVEGCGPSLSADFWTATPALAEMVGRGYVVVAPDYPGLASAMPHPFLVGVDTARSVLDAMRAARSIPGAGAGARFAVWGESQGGHAALWTASQARRYAPELTLAGTAAAAPPTDLPDNLRLGSDANLRAMMSAFVAYSWSQRYGAPLATLFSRVNQGVVTRLARNNCITLGANPRLGTMLGVVAVRNALKAKDMTRTQPWARLASLNSVEARSVPGPLLIAQAVTDPLVASQVTRAFGRRACAAGTRLRYISLPGGDHAHSARDSATATLDWIDARFAGRPAPSDCGRF
ncbi:MAG: alpha/beta fold hydrolase [Novosphingobium sp.]